MKPHYKLMAHHRLKIGQKLYLKNTSAIHKEWRGAPVQLVEIHRGVTTLWEDLRDNCKGTTDKLIEYFDFYAQPPS